MFVISMCLNGIRPALAGASPEHRGVCFVAGPRAFNKDAFKELAALNVTWISATPFGWMEGGKPTVRTETEHVWWGESDRGMEATFRGAKAEGIKVLLNPHIWIRSRTEGEWRGTIRFDTEAEWLEWERTYRAFMMHYARLADRHDVDALCIGTELRGAVTERPQFWHGLIDSVRSVYGGKLTYAANWYLDYEEVTFWDALDFAGIQAYFPLASAEDNISVELLTTSWQAHREALERFQAKVGKPIVFTEAGYRSTADGPVEPWLWHSDAPVSAEVQAACYEAMFEVFWKQPWFDGAFIWKWYPYPERRTGRRVGDFTPQGKPAEAVMARWYGVRDVGEALPEAVE